MCMHGATIIWYGLGFSFCRQWERSLGLFWQVKKAKHEVCVCVLNVQMHGHILDEEVHNA